MLSTTLHVRVKVTLVIVQWTVTWIIVLYLLCECFWCCKLVMNQCGVWCLHLSNLVIYRIHQNHSSPRIVAFQSNGLRPNTGQTNPVDLRDMLTSACPHSLSHFPSLFFLPCSDQRGRNPPQQLSVQTDSVKRFPSIFLSLTHTHTHTNHFPSLLHTNAFFPSHTFIKRVRVLLKDENVFVRGCFLPWAGTGLLLTIKKKKKYCSQLY